MQTQLSNSMVQIKIAENEAEAQLVRARKQAEQVVVTAEAESEERILAGRGEGPRILQEGFSEASVLLRKIQSFSDPRLYALSIVAQGLSKCNQPLVPERVFISGGGGGAGRAARPMESTNVGALAGNGVFGLLLNMLVAEKSGFQLIDQPGNTDLKEFTEKVAKQAMDAIQSAVETSRGGMPHRGNGTATPPPTVLTAARKTAPPKPKA